MSDQDLKDRDRSSADDVAEQSPEGVQDEAPGNLEKSSSEPEMQKDNPMYEDLRLT